MSALLAFIAGCAVGVALFLLYSVAVARWLTKDPDA